MYNEKEKVVPNYPNSLISL